MSDADKSKPAWPLRLGLAGLRAIRPLVPQPRRAAWLQEWEAELRHLWGALEERGPVGLRQRLDLLRRASGALPDAAWLRRQFTLDSELFHDAAHGLRLLRRSPSFAAAATLVLALALGSSIALFAVVDVLVLRPLPYPEPERLLTLWQTNPRQRVEKDDLSPGNFLDWRERSRSFEILAAAIPWSRDWIDAPEPESWPGIRVTEGFFDALGVRPLFGRTFRADEHVAGRDRVMLLSHALWRRHFASDPAVVGRAVRFDDGVFTIIGVLPPDFDLGLLPRTGGRWWFSPHVVAEHERRTRGSAWWHAVGRLKRGVTPSAARAELETLSKDLASENPRTNEGVAAVLIPLHQHLVSGIRPALVALGFGAALLLLIAWANVAGLLLARLLAREREFAVRASLGAGRARLLRQLLAETAMLVGCGGISGLLLAGAAIRALVRLSPVAVPRAEAIQLDARVLGFALGLFLLTTFACALLPALRLLRRDLVTRAREGRTLSGGRERARRALVVAQLALALTLLTASGLLLRSVTGLLRIDPGFQRERLLALQVFAWDRNRSLEKRARFFEEVEARLTGVPGVAGAGAVSMMPFSEAAIDIRTPAQVEGRPAAEAGQEPNVYLSIATPGYFETMRIALRRGRLLDARDSLRETKVVVINEALQRRLFAGEDPLGRRIAVRWEGKPLVAEVVGIVASVHQARLEREAAPELYLSHAQVPFGSMTLVVRTQTDPAALLRECQRAVWAVDPLQTFARTALVDELVTRTVADRRFLMYVAGVFALVSLLLSGVGAYALLSYLVTGRTREIGVRVALGARSGQILALVLREGMLLLGIGLTLGLGGALAAGRALQGFLFGIEPHDPATLLLVSAAVAAVGLLASGLPAGRAARIDPVRALRAE